MNRHGFVRVTAACHTVTVADPQANADSIIGVLREVPDSDVVVFPECAVTGYTCADLFNQESLLRGAIEATWRIAEAVEEREQLVVVGLPVAAGSSLFNAAAVLYGGNVLGVVPKQFVPNYKEYYEQRWFSSAQGHEPEEIDFDGHAVPFGIDLLFACGNLIVAVEICEDLWMPIPPSSFQTLAGANLVLNLSASNETIGKSAYRKGLVVNQSGRCITGYAFASAGPTESTTDLVFSGHCLIAENGRVLDESTRVGDGRPVEREPYWITADVDVERMLNERRMVNSFADNIRHLTREFRVLEVDLSQSMTGLKRHVEGTPFVPRREEVLEERCAEIFGIQCAGLAKRVEQLPADQPLYVGVSGGLDSTLALLVAVKMCDMLDCPRGRVHGLTMPGFGTTSKTRKNAHDLMEHLGVTAEEIDIRALCLDAFRSLDHRPLGIDTAGLSVDEFQRALSDLPDGDHQDLVFENVQARMRTFLLMNRGFVIGTGDMSESALGWSTYNGDHMSMYNPNFSIPKTLVRFLVRYVANHEYSGAARETLLSISETTISPELLPPDAEGKIAQDTEEALGPYELHDFFLFHVVRNGFAREKILFLAEHADFSREYAREEVERTLETFYRRFFAYQFKRSCVPDAPKVGTVSLSPRGDWRMPSDAESSAWRSPDED